MLCFYCGFAAGLCLVQSELQNLLSISRIAEAVGKALAARAYKGVDIRKRDAVRHAECGKELICSSLRANEPEQDMLRAYKAVVKFICRFPRQAEYALGGIGIGICHLFL